MIRGDVIGARAKSSKGLGMAGKGWDLGRGTVSTLVSLSGVIILFCCWRGEISWLWSRALLSHSSHWSGKDCEEEEEEEEEELCLPSRGGSNYL